MMVEMPGKEIGTVTIQMSMGDMPENEISFCEYNGETIDISDLMNYYISDN